MKASWDDVLFMILVIVGGAFVLLSLVRLGRVLMMAIEGG